MNKWNFILMLILAGQANSLTDTNHSAIENFLKEEGNGTVFKEESYAKKIIVTYVICTAALVVLAMLLVCFKVHDNTVGCCSAKNVWAAKENQDIELTEIFLSDKVDGENDTDKKVMFI